MKVNRVRRNPNARKGTALPFPDQPPPGAPVAPTSAPPSPLKNKMMFNQDEKHIIALGPISMKNQKISHVKQGLEDADVVTNVGMHMYLNKYMKKGDAEDKVVKRVGFPIEELDAANKSYVDGSVKPVELAVREMITQIRDFKPHDAEIKSLQSNIKAMKSVSVLRTAMLFSDTGGQFHHGLFFRDAKITSLMVSGARSSKLYALYNKVVNTSGANTIERVAIKPKGNSNIEYDFVLDVSSDAKYLSFSVDPAVGVISITVFYEQRSALVPSREATQGDSEATRYKVTRGDM